MGYAIVVDEFCGDLWNKGTLTIIHPFNPSKQLKLAKCGREKDYESWSCDEVDRSFCHGVKNSVIIFGIIDG